MTVTKMMMAAQILCSLVVSCTSVNTDDMTGLLSRLYRSAAQNNKPLVLVIDRSDQQHQKSTLKASNLLESSDEKDDGVPAVFLIKNFRSQPQRPRTSNQEYGRNRLYRGQYKTKSNLQKYRGNRGKLRVYGSTPSPVLKSLLRFKNQVSCKVNIECQIECEQNYSGKKQEKCEDKCDEDFDCDDPAEDYDECDPDSNDCDEDQNPSTRGERLVTETPTCTRC